MNSKTRQDVVNIINSRFEAICAGYNDTLRGELEMAIDLAGLTGAIDIPDQRNYVERLNRIIDRAHQAWADVYRKQEAS